MRIKELANDGTRRCVFRSDGNLIEVLWEVKAENAFKGDTWNPKGYIRKHGTEVYVHNIHFWEVMLVCYALLDAKVLLEGRLSGKGEEVTDEV